MKLLKYILIVLALIANLIFAPYAWADGPEYTKNPDYIEVSKALTLNNLLKIRDTQIQSESYVSQELQKAIAQLELQKHALESGMIWGQCRNQTSKTLAVYGPKSDVDDYPYDNELYFLGAGQTTRNKWDCEGVYLPSQQTMRISPDGRIHALTSAVAIKIADGTCLVVKESSDADVELNITPNHIFKAGEVKWFIPNVSQTAIDAQIPNVPTARF